MTFFSFGENYFFLYFFIFSSFALEEKIILSQGIRENNLRAFSLWNLNIFAVKSNLQHKMFMIIFMQTKLDSCSALLNFWLFFFLMFFLTLFAKWKCKEKLFLSHLRICFLFFQVSFKKISNNIKSLLFIAWLLCRVNTKISLQIFTSV